MRVEGKDSVGAIIHQVEINGMAIAVEVLNVVVTVWMATGDLIGNGGNNS